MKTITEQSAILALLPDFSQTILENGGNGETIEHGKLNLGDDNECKARIIYALPADGKYDDSNEFLGDWNAHMVRMEIDQDTDTDAATGKPWPQPAGFKIKMSRTMSSCGPVLRGYLGDFRVEADPNGQWVHVIDEDGDAACFDKHPWGWAEGGDNRVLGRIFPEDWAVIKTAVEEAAK